ncbi:MAG: hypothetical protein RBG13Loki_0159 [Promethearchaeota archaeon CR_4]|nr:MAG: hypothetical protein RBG13Loki_0159 [Candidatus Lokiarchaeota archaeon CR_4]
MTTGWGFRAVAVEVELAPVVWEPAKWIVIGILLVIAGIAVVLLVMWLRRRES